MQELIYRSIGALAARSTYFILDDANIAAVPIPATAWLFASGIGLLGWMRRRVAT